MNSFISVPLCVISWAFTLIRFRVLLRQGIRGSGQVSLHIWGMLLSFSIAFTFIIAEFVAFFDAHTFPSLSLLVTNSAFLVSQYFGMTGIILGMDIPVGRRIIHWVKLFLMIELATLFLIYIIFVSKVQATSFFAPQSLPEAMLIVTVSSFAILMSVILMITQLVYFPSKKFTILRIRTALMILSVAVSIIFLLTRAVIFAAYIWQFPVFPITVLLSYVSLICTTLLFFAALLSDKLYARFLIISGCIESWRAFRDIKYLLDRLIVLCPIIGLPPETPGFWRFLLKPEYYLYRAIIIILDSKALLTDFFSETMEPETPQILWEEDLRQEAERIHQALQAANPSNDFTDIVETYRRVSIDLFAKNAAT